MSSARGNPQTSAIPFATAFVGLAVVGQQTEPRIQLGGMLVCMAVAWVAFWFLSRTPLGFTPVVAIGMAARLPSFLSDPILEDDHFRYMWDGLRLLAGANPYSSAPMHHFGAALPALESSLLSSINHPDVLTIYGPGAQCAFALGQFITPGSITGLRIILICADLLAAAVVHRCAGARPAALVFLCPLLIKESAFNVHPESLAIALSLIALACARRGSWLAPVALAIASATRPFALILSPLCMPRRGSPRVMLAAAALIIATLSLIYLPFGGIAAVGSLGAFGREWEFNSSSFALIAWLFGNSAARLIVLGIVLALFAGLTWRWTFESGPTDLVSQARAALLLFGASFLLSPVANAWYALWLLPFAAHVRTPWAWAILLTVTLSYITSANLGGNDGELHPVWLRPLEYGVVAIVFALSHRRSKT